MANDTSNVLKLAALQDSDAELIEELASLSTLDYDRRRKEAAKELGVGVAALDKVVAKERKRLGLDVQSQRMMAQICTLSTRMGHGPGSTRERQHDAGCPSSDTP